MKTGTRDANPAHVCKIEGSTIMYYNTYVIMGRGSKDSGIQTIRYTKHEQQNLKSGNVFDLTSNFG